MSVMMSITTAMALWEATLQRLTKAFFAKIHNNVGLSTLVTPLRSSFRPLPRKPISFLQSPIAYLFLQPPIAYLFLYLTGPLSPPPTMAYSCGLEQRLGEDFAV